jgi:hypothetical protein
VNGYDWILRRVKIDSTFTRISVSAKAACSIAEFFPYSVRTVMLNEKSDRTMISQGAIVMNLCLQIG